jgi:flagellin
MSNLSPVQQSLVNTLAQTRQSLLGSSQRLATGSRINRASDDPAGLIASGELSARLAAIEAEARAAERDSAFASRADAALAEAGAMLIERDALEVAAANSGAMSDAERGAIRDMIASIDEAAGRILASASFEGVRIFDGQRIVHASSGSLALPSPDELRSPDAINTVRARLGSIRHTRDTVDLDTLNSELANLSSARSSIIDTDFASEAADLTKIRILQRAGVSMLSMANTNERNVLTLLTG